MEDVQAVEMAELELRADGACVYALGPDGTNLFSGFIGDSKNTAPVAVIAAEIARRFNQARIPDPATCQCDTCRDRRFQAGERMPIRMVLCAVCGNKRCPHAADHRLVCTGSNEPGQWGSSYGPRVGVESPSAANALRLLAAVVEEMDKKHNRRGSRGNAPEHGHSIAGVWDDDNGVLAGKPCAWCAIWNEARRVVEANSGA